MACVFSHNGKQYSTVEELLKALQTVKPSEYSSEMNKELSNSPFTIDEELNIMSMMNLVYIAAIQNSKDKHIRYSELQLKKQIVAEVIKYVSNNKQQFNKSQLTLIGKALTEIKDNSDLWDLFKSQINTKFGVTITEDDALGQDSYLAKEWDDKKQDNINPILTANDEIKRLVNKTLLVDPNAFTLDENGNKQYTVEYNTPTGFPNTLDWTVHSTELFKVTQGAINKEDMLTKLQTYATYSRTAFGKSLHSIINELKNNENLLAAWTTVFDKAILDSYRDLLKENEIGKELNIDISNKQKAAYRLANIWQNDIITKAENKYFTDTFNTQWEEDFKKLLPKLSDSTIDDSTLDEYVELVSRLGITLEPSAIYYIKETRPHSFNKEVVAPILRIKGLTKEQKQIAYIDNYIKNDKFNFNEYGNLFRLANSVALFSEGLTNFSTTNIKRNLVYDPQNHGFLTAFFRDIQHSSENAYNKLIDYTKVAANHNSFFLWGDQYSNDNKIDETPINKGTGIFDYYLDKGIKVPLSDKSSAINETNLRKFKLFKYEGSRDLTNDIASEYTELTQYDWTLKTLLYYLYQKPGKNSTGHTLYPIINPADRGNTMFLSLPRFEMTDDEYRALITNDIEAIKQSTHFKLIRNTVYDELISMMEAKRVLFDLTEDGQVIYENGKPKLHPSIVDGSIKPQLYYHYQLDENGEPDYTKGNVFKFYNLILDTGSAQYTLNDYDYFLNDTQIDFKNLLFNSFNVNSLLKTKIKRRRKDISKDSAPKDTTIGDTINDFVVSYISNNANIAREHLTGYSKLLSEINIKESGANLNTSPLLTKSFGHHIAEFSLNTYLANTEQYRMFQGSLADYKSRIDANKRAGQVNGNGLTNTLTGEFSAVTISDIKLKSKIYAEMVKQIGAILSADFKSSTLFNKNGKLNTKALQRLMIVDNEANLKNDLEKQVYSILKPYLTNDSANATSLVTFDEFKRRVSGFGKYEQYRDIINKIETGVELNREDYTRFATLQKNFYYGYNYNADLRKFVPNQVKNAEVILTPSLIKNLQLEDLNNIMNKTGVVQVNLESAEKIGSYSILNISDEDGNLLEDLNSIEQLFLSNKRQYHYENLKMQLEVPDHIIDEYNKLGVQISKKILDNIRDDATYTIHNLPFTGLDLKEHLFELLNNNIDVDASNIMIDFGVLLDEDGLLKNEVDLTKLSNELIDQCITRGLTKNNIYSVKLNDNNEFNIPLFFSTYSTIWQNLLTSIFTNRVTSQKFPGIHAAQMANLFMNPKLGLTSEHLQSNFANRQGIEWHDSITTDPDRKKDLKLRSRILYQEGENKIIEAEVLLPRWSSLFYTTDENGIKKGIDINTLSDDVRKMIGYRIPTESKYSMYVFKVVGFLPDDNGASIILPDDFVTQTGSDFDIDSVYTMMYNLEKDKNENIINTPYIDFVQSDAVQERVEKTFKNKDHLKYTLSKIVTSIDEYDSILQRLTEITNLKLEFGKYMDLPHVKEIKAKIKELKENKQDKRLSKSDRINIEFDIYSLQSVLSTNEFVKEFYAQYDDIRDFESTLKDRIKEYYQDKSIEAQNTKDARQNRILDIYFSILNHPEHYIESLVGATFADISTSKNILEQLKSSKNHNAIIANYYEGKQFDPAKKEIIDNLTYRGQQRLRELAIAGRELKGISVAMNGFISIGQKSGMTINGDIAPKVIIKTTSNREKDVLLNNFDGSAEKIDGTWYVTVKLTKIGNNNKGNYVNIHGKKITSYFAQIPTNVLDNVKDPLPDNVNTYTIGVWSLLPMIGGDFNLSTLFVNQPVVTDIVKFVNENIGDKTKRNREISSTKSRYQTLLYRVITKLENNPKNQVREWDSAIAKGKNISIANNPYQRKLAYSKLGYKDETAIPLMFDTLANNIGVTSDREINELLTAKEPDIKRLSEIRDHLVYQLEILETYKQYDNIAKEVTKLSNVCNTDRIGAGPTFETTSKLINGLDSLSTSKVILINGNPAVTEIYSKFFNNPNESAYPTLEKYLTHSNLLSLNAFSNLFIEYTPIAVALKNTLLGKLNAGEYHKDVIARFTKYINTSLLHDLPWLHDISNSQINNLLGRTEEGKSIPILHEFEFNSPDVFNNLSLANQIMLLKNRKGKLTNHVLNYLELETQQKDFDRNSYYRVTYMNNESLDDVVRSVNDMWYSDDVYDRIFARNLVKYEYVVSGFNYGYVSLAKIIPNTIFKYETEIFDNGLDGFNEKGIGLASHLYGKLDIAKQLSVDPITYTEDLTYGMRKLFNTDIYSSFMRSNWENDFIVPNASPVKERLDDNTTSQEPIRVFQVKNDIIAIPVDKFNSPIFNAYSKIKNSEFIKLSLLSDKTKEPTFVIFKRIDDFVTVDENEQGAVLSGTIYYYPVTKLESGESRDKSVKLSNNKLPNGNDIQSSEYYYNYILGLREKDKYTEKIKSDQIAMNMKNSGKDFRDDLNNYKSTFDLIKAGKRTATTRNLTTGEGAKWKNLKVGDIIKIQGQDAYIRVTVSPYVLSLDTHIERENWSKLEGWSITHLRREDENYEELAREKKLIQFQYEYLGNLDKVMNLLKLELDNTDEVKASLYNSNYNTADMIDHTNEVENLIIKCK